MNIVLVLILVGLMAMVVVSLVRGIVAFLRSSRDEIDNPGAAGPSANQIKQNNAMRARLMYQGAAVVLLALIMAAAS